MSMQSIRAVLFDYGGVIADEGFHNGLRAMAREQGLEPDATSRTAGLLVYETGLILGRGSEAAFWQAMREQAGLEGDDNTMTRRVLDGFVLRPWMIGRVQRLNAEGYVTGILSDQCHWLDELDARDHFFHHFDHVFNSYHMGRGKRDPGLFPEIAAKLSLQPGEILFVDDLQTNIERAQAAGWQTILYVDKTGFLESIDEMLGADHP